MKRARTTSSDLYQLSSGGLAKQTLQNKAAASRETKRGSPPLPNTRQRGARLRYTRPYQIKVRETKQRFMFSHGQMGCSFSRKRGCLYNCTSGHASHFAPDKCHTNSRNVRCSTPHFKTPNVPISYCAELEPLKVLNLGATQLCNRDAQEPVPCPASRGRRQH